MLHPELYSTDAKGNVRVWRIEQDGARYRSVTGILGKKMTESGWTTTEPKNVGRSNATTEQQQADAEVAAMYDIKKKENYHTDVSLASSKKFIEPMLAQKWSDKPFTESDYRDGAFVQPKLDGIRGVLTGEGFTSRNGREIVSVPHIVEALQSIAKEEKVVFDGELYNHDLKSDFNSITSIVKKTKPSSEDLEKSKNIIQYHVYDLAIEGMNFAERILLLDTLVRGIPSVEVVLTNPVKTADEVDAHFSSYLSWGYEGLIARRNAPYEFKRSKNLLKHKEFLDEEFTVVDIQEGNGNWAGKAKRIVCRDEQNNLTFEAGVRGTFDFTAALLQNKEKYIGKPVTIRFFNRTPDNIPRFGVATRFWADGEKE